MQAIASVPSFALWLLLHDVDIQALHTRDLGGTATTAQVTQAVCEAVCESVAA